MATRMSLLRSVRLREQRDQIGNAPSPFVSGLLAVETRCLVRLSEAARTSQRAQIALNAIVKAQQLERSHQDLSFDVAQEFAGVLWMQKEQKMAIEFLRELLQQRHPDLATPTDNVVVNKQRAILLARVVRSRHVTDAHSLSHRAAGRPRLVYKSRQIFANSTSIRLLTYSS